MIVCQVDNGSIMIVVLGCQLYYIRNELQYKNGVQSSDLFLKGKNNRPMILIVRLDDTQL